jgi:hypothetical protein
VPSFQPKSRFVPTEVDLEQYPHLKTSSCAAPFRTFAARRRTRPHPISPRSHAGRPSMAWQCLSSIRRRTRRCRSVSSSKDARSICWMASIGDDGVMCRVGLLSRLGRRLVITPKGEMFEADRQHRTIPEPGLHRAEEMLRERRPHSFSRQVCLRLAARVRSGVNRVGLTPCRALAVLRCEQTSAVSVGMSQTCHNRT